MMENPMSVINYIVKSSAFALNCRLVLEAPFLYVFHW